MVYMWTTVNRHGPQDSYVVPTFRAIAHRILIPAFGPLSIRNMFPGMVDIATQLVEKVRPFMEPIDRGSY